MSEHTWQGIEVLGHWLLAWTVVVGFIAVWIFCARPRRATVRYGGWLVATFAGAALLPALVGVGPRVTWHQVYALLGRPDRFVEDRGETFPTWFTENSPVRS